LTSQGQLSQVRVLPTNAFTFCPHSRVGVQILRRRIILQCSRTKHLGENVGEKRKNNNEQPHSNSLQGSLISLSQGIPSGPPPVPARSRVVGREQVTGVSATHPRLGAPAWAVQLGSGSRNFAPSSFGFSAETLGEVCVLLKIKFHLLPVVQELGPGLGGRRRWQQPLEQVETLFIPREAARSCQRIGSAGAGGAPPTLLGAPTPCSDCGGGSGPGGTASPSFQR